MEPTWQLLPDPITADVYSSLDDAPLVASESSGGLKLFGRGILRPLRRDSSGDFQNGTAGDLLKSAVALVLNTTCSSKSTAGELPWRTEFGSIIELLRLRNNNVVLKHLAEHYIADALRKWIPSLRLTAVVTQPGAKLDRVVVRIRYDVVDPSGTRVVVPGLETSVQVG